jgi:hypothetical protein
MTPQSKKHIIHVNQHVIRSNIKHDKKEPVLSVKHKKSNTYAFQAIIKDDNGNQIARVVYSPDKPLSCGARVWIETENEPELILTDKSKDEPQ